MALCTIRAKVFRGFLFRKATRTWNIQTHGKPVIHQSSIERKLNQQNTGSPPYQPWIIKLEHEVEPWTEFQKTQNHVV